jgi:hypothetical protein
VLDALDEYNARELLLQILADFANVDNVQTIVTSRDEADIREALSLQISPESVIVLQSAVVNEDIRSYVSHRLQTGKDFQRWRNHSTIQDKIKKALIDKADSMYEFVQPSNHV